MSANNNFIYRRDIDGIRAIAVLSVILFHINSDILPGGFIGVDIFFVISGFLITGIIFSEFQPNHFSTAKFYTKRIKRILPAMYFMVFITIILGYFLLLPNDLYLLAKSAIFSIASLSNIYFNSSTDYFSPLSETLPLLHTWSLSIEEQFYIIFPISFYVLFKKAPNLKTISYVVTFFIIISIAYSIFLSLQEHNIRAGYYSLIARSGEFLLGAIVAINYKKIKIIFNLINPILIQAITIALIIYSLAFISSESSYPSVNYLFPVFLTLLLILCGSYKRPVLISQVLSTNILVYFGKISYSLYLWHWPVLAYLRYIYLENDIPALVLLYAIFFIWIISHISWKYIENPYRKKNYTFKEALFNIAIFPATIIILILTSIYITTGFPSRFGENANKLLTVAPANTCHGSGINNCFNGNQENKNYKVALFGDSHAGHYSEVFRQIGIKKGFSIEINTNNNCPLLIGLTPKNNHDLLLNKRCSKLIEKLTNSKNNYTTIILALRWEDGLFSMNGIVNKKDEEFYASLVKTIDHLKKNNINIILLGQIPKYKLDINRYELVSRPLGIEKEIQLDLLYEKANFKVKEIAKEKEIHFFDFSNLFCNNVKCQYKDDNNVWYKDDDHLNQIGAKILAEKIMNDQEYQKLLNLIEKKSDEGH